MRRVLSGLLVAVAIAGGLIATVPTHWSVVCLALERDSIPWYIFGCNIDPPPGDPQG